MSSPLPDAPPTPLARLAGLFLGRPRVRLDQVDSLDGLRGLAVLLVLASHLSNAGMGLVPGLSLSGTGKSGVYLFFVLSAFLLVRLLLKRTPAQFADARLWADYALRRVLRIWPLYLVVLLSAWWFTRSGHAGWHYQLDDAALWRHLTLREGQSVLWSIPVEFVFYLVLPFVAWVLAVSMARGWPWWLETLGFVAALAAASWAWPPATALENDVRLGPYLAIFLCGAFAARLDHRIRAAASPPSSRAWGIVGLVAIAALLLTVPVAWAALAGTPVDYGFNHRWFVFFGLAWSALLLAVLHGPRWLRRPFASAPARWVGVVSFSAYLWHMPVLDLLRAHGLATWPLPALWALLVALAVAGLSFLVFERPWRDLRFVRKG